MLYLQRTAFMSAQRASERYNFALKRLQGGHFRYTENYGLHF